MSNESASACVCGPNKITNTGHIILSLVLQKYILFYPKWLIRVKLYKFVSECRFGARQTPFTYIFINIIYSLLSFSQKSIDSWILHSKYSQKRSSFNLANSSKNWTLSLQSVHSVMALTLIKRLINRESTGLWIRGHGISYRHKDRMWKMTGW